MLGRQPVSHRTPLLKLRKQQLGASLRPHSIREQSVFPQNRILDCGGRRGTAVGSIEFRGNRHFSDSTLRRMMVLNEGDPFNYRQLRQSLNRLNTAGFFKPITKDQVIIQRDPAAHQLDLMLNLEEPARGGWG
ncbi:MAG TPA: POTRA domain-containing protein [Terriglobia bacterium]|nr:POTRA domain-containing protein [Terriglobia bacterium]